jgi:hypothetical protein
MAEHIEYQSKVPIRLRAVKWDGGALALQKMREMCNNAAEFRFEISGLEIRTMTGLHSWTPFYPVSKGEYVTRAQGGSILVRNPTIFEYEYERAREGSWL